MIATAAYLDASPEVFDNQIIGQESNVIFVDFNREKESKFKKIEQSSAAACRFTKNQQLRLLTEVDHLVDSHVDGGFNSETLVDVAKNHFTQVQEIGMPYAITTTEHDVEVVERAERIKRVSTFLGKTAIETAESGFEFHQAAVAHERVRVEVEEAIVSEDMQPGRVYAFISPKISRAEADYETAKSEHVGDDDAIRISYLTPDGSKRIMQSMLVRDIPLQAWVDMLADPNNIFGKSVKVEDPERALSVMKVFRDLEVPVGVITSPLDTTRCAASYIGDDDKKQKVMSELDKYQDQRQMKEDAKKYGNEWLQHTQQLAESLATTQPTSYVKSFIYGKNQHLWCKEDLAVIDACHDSDGNLVMTRALAAVVENMHQKFMEMRISSVHAPEYVLQQVGAENLTKIRSFEHSLYSTPNGHIPHQVLNQNNFLTSLNYESANRGCAGGSKNSQASDVMNELNLKSDSEQNADSSSSETISFNKKGVCRVKSCDTRPGQTDVGPCSVCKSCQAKFDAGQDPTKLPEYKPPKAKESSNVFMLFGQKTNLAEAE